MTKGHQGPSIISFPNFIWVEKELQRVDRLPCWLCCLRTPSPHLSLSPLSLHWVGTVCPKMHASLEPANVASPGNRVFVDINRLKRLRLDQGRVLKTRGQSGPRDTGRTLCVAEAETGGVRLEQGSGRGAAGLLATTRRQERSTGQTPHRAYNADQLLTS